MHLGSRIYLILASLLCGGYFAYLGMVFSRGVKPELYSAATIVFWLLTGLSVASPLWLPAVIPERFSRVARAARWLGVIGCLVLLLPFGSAVIHNVRRAFAGYEVFWSVLAANSLLFLMCLVGIGTILWSGRAVSGMRA